MSIFNNHSAEILILLFFVLTYFFSVIEKVADWKGTIAYYKNHFRDSIFNSKVPLLLAIVLLFEIVVLVLLSTGSYYLIVENSPFIAKIGLEVSAITLLLFLIGQRVAKDYPGATSITVYFILNTIGLYLLG